MPEPLTLQRTVRRPTLLIGAARHLVALRPNRTRLLQRVLRAAPAADAALQQLADCEEGLEAQRLAADPAYCPRAHVEALGALIFEMSRAAEDADQAKASGSSAFRLSTKSSSDSRIPASIPGA